MNTLIIALIALATGLLALTPVSHAASGNVVFRGYSDCRPPVTCVRIAGGVAARCTSSTGTYREVLTWACGYPYSLCQSGYAHGRYVECVEE